MPSQPSSDAASWRPQYSLPHAHFQAAAVGTLGSPEGLRSRLRHTLSDERIAGEILLVAIFGRLFATSILIESGFSDRHFFEVSFSNNESFKIGMQ